MKHKICIAWMFPDILNLHGDKGNIMALQRISKLLLLDPIIYKINNLDNLNLDNTDILLFNPGEVKSIKKITSELSKCYDELKKYIESNKTIILIGTSGMIMAKNIYKNNKLYFSGLGFLDMNCYIRNNVTGGDLIFRIKNSSLEIVGNQIQVFDTVTNNNLGIINHGLGNGDSKSEGAKFKNVIFTNALGPVLIKNPWWSESIIKEACLNKNIEIKKSLTKEQFHIEIKSASLIKEFISKYN